MIFTVELAVMVVLDNTLPSLDPRWYCVLDAVLLTLVCTPVLWWLMSDRRRVEAERAVRARQQLTAYEFGRRALACDDVSVLLNEAVACLADTLHADFVGIWEVQAGQETLLRAGVGWQRGAVGQSKWQAAMEDCAEGAPFPCRAYAEGKVHGHCRRCSPLLEEHGARSGICVVIQGERRPFGIIGAYSQQERTFSGDDIHFLQEIAIEITLAVQRSQTEQRRRERETLRAEQMALVAQLATGVAHEIRNPLTSVKMLIQANREDQGGQPLSQEDLRIIEGEIRRMERSLQTFLDYARPPKPERKLVDLCALVHRTLALSEARAARQNVQLRFRPPAVTRQIEADGGQLQQVLLNLAINALDAMPHGGTLEIVLQEHEDCTELAVLDSGPGVNQDMQNRLFQPFATNKESGVGLGLVICRRIAEDHGGSLTLENRPEGGARSTLRLPLYRPAQVACLPPAS